MFKQIQYRAQLVVGLYWIISTILCNYCFKLTF